jgi:hypothetical protein
VFVNYKPGRAGLAARSPGGEPAKLTA